MNTAISPPGMSRAAEVAEWLDKLPVIPVHDMAEEDRICCICDHEYAKHNPEGVMECPVRLPGAGCGHIFGKECLKKWLMENDTVSTVPRHGVLPYPNWRNDIRPGPGINCCCS